jgi:hypothetical protein
MAVKLMSQYFLLFRPKKQWLCRTLIMPSSIVYVVVTAAAVVLFIGCSKKSSGPTAPENPPPVKNVIFTDDFENGLSSDWNQLIYQIGWTMMSIASDCGHSPTHSLTSTDSMAGLKRQIYPSIMDSIAGLEFFLLAKQNEHIDFYAALATTGSSANGLAIVMGLGLSKTDSLMYVYQAGPDSVSHKVAFAAPTFNTWYKCNIEYDFNTSIITYSLNDTVIHQQTVPAVVAPPAIQWVVTVRENPGIEGLKQYYIDDVTLYKR